MRIRMKTTMAGPMGAVSAGQVVDLPKDQASLLVKGGYAELQRAPAEQAVKAKAEKSNTKKDKKD